VHLDAFARALWPAGLMAVGADGGLAKGLGSAEANSRSVAGHSITHTRYRVGQQHPSRCDFLRFRAQLPGGVPRLGAACVPWFELGSHPHGRNPNVASGFISFLHWVVNSRSVLPIPVGETCVPKASQWLGGRGWKPIRRGSEELGRGRSDGPEGIRPPARLLVSPLPGRVTAGSL
jgi:hypothetical protein